MATIEQVIRGIPAWLMGEYLQEMGGEKAGNGRYIHPQWSVTVTQIEDYQLGSLRIGQIQFQVDIANDALEQFHHRLHLKLLRGGG